MLSKKNQTTSDADITGCWYHWWRHINARPCITALKWQFF